MSNMSRTPAFSPSAGAAVSRPPAIARPAHVIGAPCDLGANRRGAAMGPAAIRTAGLADRLAARGLVVDEGDVLVARPGAAAQDPRKRFIAEIADVVGAVYERSLASLRAGGRPIVLGGDHSVSAGSAAASATYLRERGALPLGLIWVDAHGDMNTPATTPSGNVHGMPLAALLGDEPRELAAVGGWTRKVSPRHTVLLGLRSVDDEEWVAIKDAGIHVVTMEDIRRRGLDDVMDEVQHRLTDGTGGVHVSLDVDVCDPAHAPGVSTPAEDGLAVRDAHIVMERLGAGADIVSLDIVEVNPAYDVRNATAELGIALAMSLLAGGETWNR